MSDLKPPSQSNPGSAPETARTAMARASLPLPTSMNLSASVIASSAGNLCESVWYPEDLLAKSSPPGYIQPHLGRQRVILPPWSGVQLLWLRRFIVAARHEGCRFVWGSGGGCQIECRAYRARFAIIL